MNERSMAWITDVVDKVEMVSRAKLKEALQCIWRRYWSVVSECRNLRKSVHEADEKYQTLVVKYNDVFEDALSLKNAEIYGYRQRIAQLEQQCSVCTGCADLAMAVTNFEERIKTLQSANDSLQDQLHRICNIAKS